MTTLHVWISTAARTAFGVMAIVMFCATVGLAIAWALVMGRPSPLGREEDGE